MTSEVVALADFGSTFTKLTLVEAGSGRRLAASAAPTTVASDVMEGYGRALDEALGALPSTARIVARLAASSAGGGLRVAAVGLVGDYTAAAARQAALNAGAKVELVLTGTPGGTALAALSAARPDIVLFSGGTDGGQRRQVLENAEALASAPFAAHVIVACNREAAPEAARLLEAGGHRTHVVANVLPEIDRLDIEPARAAIRDLFIEHVIMGKGLSTTAEFGRAVVMPTPEAVLVATRLLALGPDGAGGVGDVMVLDIGGATTDVHSSATPVPLPVGISARGLPPLPLARSVQGDLGMRWSAASVLEADREWLVGRSGLAPEALAEACRRRHAAPDFLATEPQDAALDRLLATACLTHSVRRHCGSVSTIYVPGQGSRFVQEGLDLRDMPLVIGTGGMLARDPEGETTLAEALDRREKGSLVPARPRVAIDRSYILAAAGLLAGRDPAAAYRLMTSELGLGAR